MSLPKSALGIVVLPLLLGLAAGCDDQATNPAGPGGPSDSTNVSVFQGQSVTAIEPANGVAASVDEVAPGDARQVDDLVELP